LYGYTPERFVRENVEIVAVLDATDEACAESFQARWSYANDDIRWDSRFVPMMRANPNTGGFDVNDGLLNDFVPVSRPMIGETEDEYLEEILEHRDHDKKEEKKAAGKADTRDKEQLFLQE